MYSANGKTPNYDLKSEIIMCFLNSTQYSLNLCMNAFWLNHHYCTLSTGHARTFRIFVYFVFRYYIHIIIYWKYQKHNWLIVAYLTPSLSILRPCNTWLWAVKQSKRKQFRSNKSHIMESPFFLTRNYKMNSKILLHMPPWLPSWLHVFHVCMFTYWTFQCAGLLFFFCLLSLLSTLFRFFFVRNSAALKRNMWKTFIISIIRLHFVLSNRLCIFIHVYIRRFEWENTEIYNIRWFSKELTRLLLLNERYKWANNIKTVERSKNIQNGRKLSALIVS